MGDIVFGNLQTIPTVIDHQITQLFSAQKYSQISYLEYFLIEFLLFINYNQKLQRLSSTEFQIYNALKLTKLFFIHKHLFYFIR